MPKWHNCLAELRATVLRSQPAGLQVVLGGHSKRVRDAVEKGEHCDYINSLGDLILAPACLEQLLHVFVCGAAGRFSDQLGITEQRAFGQREVSFFKPSFGNGGDGLIGCSLNPQEVCVTVDSIGTAVKRGNVRGEHLFMSAREVPFREVNRV